ncbi:MAG: hypothetical protein ACOX60_04525 [Massiliimalia sp.]|jgi:hypothetical protein
MKKRYIVLGIVVLLIVFGFVWWNSKTVFLKSVSSDNIAVITVRNGQTGHRFEINNQDDISYIVESIQCHSFHKSGISLFRMGTWLTLSFTNEHGKTVNEFIINDSDVIRDDPFFYQIDHGDMQDIIDYLTNLEIRAE